MRHLWRVVDMQHASIWIHGESIEKQAKPLAALGLPENYEIATPELGKTF